MANYPLQTSRNLKTKPTSLQSLLCVGILLIFAVAPLSSWGQGTTIKIYDGITPITITQSNVNNIVNAMMTGNPSTGAWTYIPNGSSISIAQVFSYNGIGNWMNYGVAITSSTPFTMGQIQWTNSGFFSATSGTFGGQGLTYDLFGVGINYGPDGIPGTSDDIRYTTGNPNALVNAVYLLGMAESFSTADNAGTASLSFADALHAWSVSCPILEKYTYAVNGVNATAQITYVATPPALSIFSTNRNSFALTWPVFQFTNLQQNSNLNTTNWVAVTNTQNVVGSGTQVVVTNSGTRFFRLKYP